MPARRSASTFSTVRAKIIVQRSAVQSPLKNPVQRQQPPETDFHSFQKADALVIREASVPAVLGRHIPANRLLHLLRYLLIAYHNADLRIQIRRPRIEIEGPDVRGLAIYNQ